MPSAVAAECRLAHQSRQWSPDTSPDAPSPHMPDASVLVEIQTPPSTQVRLDAHITMWDTVVLVTRIYHFAL